MQKLQKPTNAALRRRRYVGVGLGEDEVTEMEMESRKPNDDSSIEGGNSSHQDVNEQSTTTSYELEKK